MSRWAKEGKLPYRRTLGGHRRFPADGIRALAGALSRETGQSAFDVFRASGSHNSCMIDAKYVSVGIGRAWGPIDGWRWTVNFGSL